MVANIPRVGMRMVKTALAVAICFFLYVLRGEEGVPIFSTIAAIICMQPYAENSIQVSINRIIGTLLGAVFALLVLYLIQYIPYQVRILRYLVISFAVIPVMYVTVLLKRTGASALAGTQRSGRPARGCGGQGNHVRLRRAESQDPSKHAGNET